jgi:predicted flavoprotein YhiN
MTELALESDFVIIRSGPAGVCAALAAARNGSQILTLDSGHATAADPLRIFGAA